MVAIGHAVWASISYLSNDFLIEVSAWIRRNCIERRLLHASFNGLYRSYGFLPEAFASRQLALPSSRQRLPL